MSAVIQVILYILIILVILSLPIKINFIKKTDIKIKADCTLFSFTLTKKDKKDKPKRKRKRSFKERFLHRGALYFGIRFLIKHSSVKINALRIKEVGNSPLSVLSSLPLFISVSSLLAYIKTNAKGYEYTDSYYIIENESDGASAPLIDFTVQFILLYLIISLIIVAYYKMKTKFKGMVKNVRKQDE